MTRREKHCWTYGHAWYVTMSYWRCDHCSRVMDYTSHVAINRQKKPDKWLFIKDINRLKFAPELEIELGAVLN